MCNIVSVYQVEVTTPTGHYFRVERRYSAFHSLNKQCKKLGLQSLSEFPPKRIRNTSAKVLESRRKGLEHFIQSLSRLSPIPQLLVTFLELPPGIVSQDHVSTRVQQHAYTTPVLGFMEDPYLVDSEDSNDMSDINMISEGEQIHIYFDPQSNDS